MSKTMLVNVRHVEESRVAILEDGVLEAYEIETVNRSSIKGNIYNAVVESVHPSLEAAFLKIGPDLKGFLPLDEVNFKLLPARGERGRGGRISQHLHQGQKLMVQVVREPFAGKPPSVSTYFSLPGRALVLMPGVDSAGVSRKIADGKQRDRLKQIIDELNPPEGFGLIVRTAGVGQTKTELQRDLKYLLRLWESVQKASMGSTFPGLVYRERDLVIRTIRDYFTPDIREVWIDSEDTYERALEFVKDVMPTKAKIIRHYTGQRPLFNKYNLEEQIESIYKRRVQLPSGGEIVIDGTEALTAIDVNSARSSRSGDAEENVTQTNLEAATEISRQLRLRDLGGLVVIDFIDMYQMRNKKKVEKRMKEAMKGDKAKHDITPISRLGLMEIARQRIKGEKMAASYTTCPNCEGYGLIKNVEPAALTALRKLQTRSARGGIGRIQLTLPGDVAYWILNNKRDDLVDLERRYDLRIEVESKDSMLRHESEIEVFNREEPPADAMASLPPMPPAEPMPEPAAEDTADSSAKSDGDEGEDAEASGKPARKRRRRRKRGGRRGSDESAEAQETAGDESEAGETAKPQEIQASSTEDRADAGDRPVEDAQNEDGHSPDKPRKAAAAGEPEGASDGPGDSGANDSEGDGAPKRRRRRRRRRSGGATAEAGQESGNGADSGQEPAPRPEPAIVPTGVRSDELMPAAQTGPGRGRGGARRPRGGKRGRG